MILRDRSVLPSSKHPSERSSEDKPRRKGVGGICWIASAYHAVLAVKDEREDALAACGGLRSLTAARAVILEARAIPPKSISRI
jgi:hypothetical protein